MARVTKPGGRMVICEVSTPVWKPFRFVYMRYLLKLLPFIAKFVSSNPVAYSYLAESMATWPDQRTLGELIAKAGWEDVAWFNLTGGMVALHRATKPKPADPTP